jgi:hypothetical protein
VQPLPSAATWKPKAGLATTLIHGAGSPAPGAEDGHVLAAVIGEAAEAVEELELGMAAAAAGGALRRAFAAAAALRRGQPGAVQAAPAACRGA